MHPSVLLLLNYYHTASYCHCTCAHRPQPLTSEGDFTSSAAAGCTRLVLVVRADTLYRSVPHIPRNRYLWARLVDGVAQAAVTGGPSDVEDEKDISGGVGDSSGTASVGGGSNGFGGGGSTEDMAQAVATLAAAKQHLAAK